LIDDFSDADFAPIAAAMKELPYFAPSPHFADKVMARVSVAGAAPVPVPLPVAARSRQVAPRYIAPPVPHQSYVPARADLRRSIPARIAATALVASFGAAVTAIVLVTVFNVDLFVLLSRVFGEGAIGFLASLASDASASASATAASSSAAVGTATGAAVIGSFIAGAAIATAGLKAAASASRKAA
jgi:hypothetical protein